MKFKIGLGLYNYLKIPLDLLFFAAAFAGAFFLRYDIHIPAQQLEILKFWLLPVIVLKFAVFYLMRIYRRLWRYASVKDFFWLAVANVVASTVLVVLFYFVFRLNVARGVLVLDGLLTLALTTGVRFGVRGLRTLGSRSLWASRTRPILIAGAGDTGAAIIREMQSRPELAFQPVGIIDDDASKKGLQVNGVRVLGTRRELSRIIADYGIEEVIICMPNVSREIIRDIFFQCQAAGVKCRTLPGIYQIIDGTVGVEQIREVGVHDILGREPVQVDLDQLSEYINGRTVMVTGAGGSIGSELSRQLSRMKPASLVLLDQDEEGLYTIEQELAGRRLPFKPAAVIADVTNHDRIAAIFTQYRPAIIFHSAAYKHVPLMEANLLEAVENNIFGTKILCELAVQNEAERFIFISTDKAVEPVSMMGLSKAICEKVVQSYADNAVTRFMSVRFGNVLESSGSVVPIFRKQIARGGPVTVTHPDMIRFFMTIPEAVQLVIQAGALGEKGEIFVLDMGEQVSIVELARNMIRLSGLEPEKDIPIEFIGARPGEKLYEKLTWDNEDRLRTKHAKIFMVRNAGPDKAALQSDLEGLKKAVEACNHGLAKDCLRNMAAQHLNFKVG
ncbi:MAG: nucleoside-diphosphate sugar epimerase/dehydratase [Dehalococcoidia bacterium]|jgi:FlaA1/EpsC-like NDP-sugar epimerase